MPPAVLVISDSDPYSFGSVAVGTSLSRTFTITNTGAVTATVLNESGLAAPFELLGGYPGIGGTCGASLAAAASCSIVVDFEPTVIGLLSDTIYINYNNGVTMQTTARSIVGSGSIQ